MHVVIVGNSIAGMEAAVLLRNREPGLRITIVSAEHDHLFARTALMYVFCGQLSLRDTEPYDRELYARMRFERVRDRVVAARFEEKTLALAGGGTLAYDRLLLAVGSRARPLPSPGAYDGPSVHHFVTLQEMEALDAAARPGMRAAVVGGGLIGVEVAEVLHQRGLHVSFVIREPFTFPVALDAREAVVVADHIRAHGVDVRLDTRVAAVEREGGRVRALALDGRDTIPCDLVVGAIGVVPNTMFLEGSGLPLAEGTRAIEVDEALRTGVPDVWAAGDCANVAWIDGARRPEQLWYTARDQGRAAARSILGDAVSYRRTAWYNSAKFFELEYTTAGWVPPGDRPHDCAMWYQQVPDQPITQRLVCRGDRVVGFNAVGSRWDHAVLLRWIAERRTLPWVLDHLEEARFDEEFTPRFRVLPSATLTPAGA